MIKPIERILHSLLLLILIGAFSSSVYYIKTAPRITPAPKVTPAVASAPTATRDLTSVEAFTPTPIPSPSSRSQATPDTGWSLLRPGLERRSIRIYNSQNQLVETVYIW